MRINDLTDAIKHTAVVDSSGSSRIDSIIGDGEFCALGIRIPTDVVSGELINSADIEKEYKSIFSTTYFNPNAESMSATKNSFTFLTMNSKTRGNHMAKYVKENVKREMRDKLKCENV